jgi:Ca2+-binding RTX toxin-like protein
MTKRIQRAGLMVALALLTAVALAGVAWAANIQCPNDPQDIGGGTCWGTEEADVIMGTSQRDEIYGFRGDDLVRAGAGADLIINGEDDYRFGEDENHGGPGADRIVGNLDSEKHFGGRGDDLLGDYKSGKNPDVFHCGAGRDEVIYNKGLDRVADDCEVLNPASKGSMYPE